MTDIQLFQILKQKLGDKEAEALVQFVDAKLKETNEQNLKSLATKEDFAVMKGELRTAIEATKAEIMKWMFGAFAMLMLAIIGLYFKH